MAVTLRLLRLGKKKNPVYRVVAVDKRKKRNGSYIEVVGFYNPMVDPHLLQVDKKKFDYWVNKGAVISSGLERLIKKGPVVKTD